MRRDSKPSNILIFLWRFSESADILTDHEHRTEAQMIVECSAMIVGSQFVVLWSNCYLNSSIRKLQSRSL